MRTVRGRWHQHDRSEKQHTTQYTIWKRTITGLTNTLLLRHVAMPFTTGSPQQRLNFMLCPHVKYTYVHVHQHSQQHTTCTCALTHVHKHTLTQVPPTPRDPPTFIRCSKCGLLLMASQLSLVPLAPSPSCTTDVRPRPLVTTPPSNTCLFCCCLAPAPVASKASRDLCWDVWKVNMKRPSTHTQSMRLSPCRERQQRRCCRSLNGKCMMDAVVCRGVGKALPSTSCDGGDLGRGGARGGEGTGGKCRDVKCIMYTYIIKDNYLFIL